MFTARCTASKYPKKIQLMQHYYEYIDLLWCLPLAKKPNKSIISMTTTSLSNFSGVYYSGNNCERFNLTGTFRLEVVSEISEWWCHCLKSNNVCACVCAVTYSWLNVLHITSVTLVLNTIHFKAWRKVGSGWKEALESSRFPSLWPRVASQLLAPWASCQEE